MKCKFCGAELDENLTLCPVCQKNNAEVSAAESSEAEAEIAEVEQMPEHTPFAPEEASFEENEAEEVTGNAEEPVEETLAANQTEKKFPLLPVILCGLAACAVVALILFGPKLISLLRSPKAEPRAEAVVYADDMLLTRESYSVLDIADSEDERMKTVVAYNGESQLTNADIQVLYCDAYFRFMNQYGSYAALIGLDPATPLWQQASTMEGYTWEHSFLSDAMSNAKAITAVREYCKENGMELTEELRSELENMPQNLEEGAIQAGYASALAYIQDSFGAGVDMAAFMKYYEGICYEQMLFESLTCTEEEIEVFYEMNPDVMTANGVSKDSADVRHILIMPADADADEVSTEEEWEAARAEAERVYALYLEDATEDHFVELAGEYNMDPGSAENGGLYEDVIPGRMVTEFNDWVFDEGRQSGDVEIVKTDYGYHIIYFLEKTESENWREGCENLLRNDKMNKLIEEVMEQYPLYVYLDDIVLDELQKPAEGAETGVEDETGSAG